VAGCCEHANEHSGSVKCGELCDWLRNCQLLKNDPAPWSWLVKQNAVLVKLVVHIDTTALVLAVVLMTSVGSACICLATVRHRPSCAAFLDQRVRAGERRHEGSH
jgi:hypothetical protein